MNILLSWTLIYSSVEFHGLNDDDWKRCSYNLLGVTLLYLGWWPVTHCLGPCILQSDALNSVLFLVNFLDWMGESEVQLIQNPTGRPGRKCSTNHMSQRICAPLPWGKGRLLQHQEIVWPPHTHLTFQFSHKLRKHYQLVSWCSRLLGWEDELVFLCLANILSLTYVNKHLEYSKYKTIA